MSDVRESGLTIDRFESGQIDAARFDHEAHVYMAWLYVGAYDLATAITRFDRALRRLTSALGVPDKYHATITWLFLILVKQRSRSGESWQAFRCRNADLVNDGKATLGRFYSDGLLSSELARGQFVLPDNLSG